MRKSVFTLNFYWYFCGAMYIFLKRIIRSLLPDSLLYKIKPALRRIFSLSYIGNKVSCPVCGGTFRKFILVENGRDLICPSCGSLPRYRFLYKMLVEDYQLISKKRRILHFSPSRALKEQIKKHIPDDYITTELFSDKEDRQYDITSINEPEGSFDMLICFHVLEHIPDDKAAISELFRITKPGGVAFIQTPFKDGEIYENPSVTSESEREKHFGQKDHVRIYSMEGLSKRLSAQGFNVEIKKASDLYPSAVLTRNGIFQDDKILVCTKP